MSKTGDNIYYGRTDDSSVLIQRLRGDVFQLIHKFFSAQGFTCIDPPILHEQILGKKHEIYLPQYENRYSLNSSNALYMGAYAAILGNVYAISPAFRDEQDSVNHLVEFRMLEAEVLDMTYSELPDFIENLITYILRELLRTATTQSSAALSERVSSLLSTFHPQRITFEAFVQEMEFSESAKWAHGTDPSDIDYEISKYIQKTVFIMDYPRKLATWTAKPKNHVASCAINLMLPGTFGELCEGCERTNDMGLLQYKMDCAGITNLQWYLNAVSRMDAPRCGFGIGVDRLVRWITGLPHIADSVLFPRVKQE